MKLLYEILSSIQKNREKAALCTVVSSKGSTPGKIGAKMIVWKNSSIWNTIGGGTIEKRVIEDAVEIIKKKTPHLFKHDLLRQHGMCCGGIMEIYVEPIMIKNRLYVFGAGHVGRALIEHISQLDFELFVIDERQEEMNKIVSKDIDKMPIHFSKILPKLPFDENSYIIIVTHDHKIDREILSYCIKQPFAYIGMIGSKRKVETTKTLFITSKIATEEELEKVDMPMGIEINAQTPDEIAISILAKIIAVKNRKV